MGLEARPRGAGGCGDYLFTAFPLGGVAEAEGAGGVSGVELHARGGVREVVGAHDFLARGLEGGAELGSGQRSRSGYTYEGGKKEKKKKTKKKKKKKEIVCITFIYSYIATMTGQFFPGSCRDLNPACRGSLELLKCATANIRRLTPQREHRDDGHGKRRHRGGTGCQLGRLLFIRLLGVRRLGSSRARRGTRFHLG